MPEQTKQYDTLEATAKKWRVSAERLKNACEQGDVNGAALFNGEWIIPVNIDRPYIKKLPQPPKPATKYLDSQGEIVARTPVQEAVIRAVDRGDNLGLVSEHRIGNTTYIVSSSFKRQGQTADEIVFNRILRGLEDEGLISKFPDAKQRKEIDDMRYDVRRNSPVFTTTKGEKMDNYRKMLLHYGFTSDEVERLMTKIEADYEEPELDTRSSYKHGK